MENVFKLLSVSSQKALLYQGFETPTEIQQKAIPILLESENDFLGQAQTGTGKTAAFLLPLFEKINPQEKHIQALILSPTRELANQILEEIKKFAPEAKACTVYGGVAYKKQIDDVRRSHIVVATPGRALDLIDKRKLDLSQCSNLIIDEADEMLKMGFIDDVEFLMTQLDEQTQTWMFSATMPKSILSLAQRKLNDPDIIKIEKKTLSNSSIEQSFMKLPKRDYIKLLKVILLSEAEFYGIIFCETKEETRILAEKLINQGLKAVSLNGDLNQRQRDFAVEMFKSRKANIMVCTDVAARGLDISQVTHVINMGLPRNNESYIHRIGRTGRAGELGKAITFVAPDEMRKLKSIERLTRQKISPYKVPKLENIKRQRIKTQIEGMQKIIDAKKEKGSDFKIDDSFAEYKEYFQDLSKEEILQVMFSHQLNKELKTIEDTCSSLTKVTDDSSQRSHKSLRSSRDMQSRSRNRSERGGSGRGGQARRSRRSSGNGEGRPSSGRRSRSRSQSY